MSLPTTYLHLEPESGLPDCLAQAPSRVVVIIEAQVTPEWQHEVSKWLIQMGCLYMMAWGLNCSEWDDSVDMANLERFDFEDIPEDEFVMTTWHNNEPLSEVLWYAKNCAIHPTIEIERAMLVHISIAQREHELLAAYAEA